MVYFFFKDMVNNKRSPAEEIDEVIPFTRLHVRKEDDQLLVLVLKWIEFESIIDDVQKKIQRMLENPKEEEQEEEKLEATEVAPPAAAQYYEDEHDSYVQQEEVSGLVSDDDEEAQVRQSEE